MNIQEAKEEISNTLKSYHEKNEEGDYCYPIVRQRPILLMGPPGIGKTAIMEQIAKENQVGLVSYTITHHTRQSAVGLPRIRERHYMDMEVSVTEYTMSEIIDSVYSCMEKSGKKEGILFIDEINCASETLAPTMLQFLQNKTFGSHKVPEGWMIVAAGNPPQYNKSVREFDIVTLDRVRKIDVEVDVDIWLSYARNASVHGAILSYLGMKKDNFYHIDSSREVKRFVTARGWEDLSDLLKSYERLNISVTEKQIIQFLQKEEIAEDFAAYYQIYRKYGMDYGIDRILALHISEEERNEKIRMAKSGGFEERFTVTELVLSYVSGEMNKFALEKNRIDRLYEELFRFKKNGKVSLEEFVTECRRSLQVKVTSELITRSEIKLEKWVVRKMEQISLEVKKEHLKDWDDVFCYVKCLFQYEKDELKKETETLKQILTRAFGFIEECFGEEQEMLLFVTGISRNEKIMEFISLYGCEEFFRFSDKLLYRKQGEKLLRECMELSEV